MTVRAHKFTPEVLLSAPRRSAASPNSTGTLALYTESVYSFQSHSKTSEICVLDTSNGQSTCLSSDLNASEPTWLGDKDLVLWLKSGDKGITNLILGDASSPHSKPETIATFDGGVSNIKVKSLDDTTVAFVVSGLCTPDGQLYNSETAEKPRSTAKVYSKLFVRQWDAYVTENKNTLWYSTLNKSSGKWTLNSTGLINALGGHPVKLESPVPPFGGTGDFDISAFGIAFVAKDPKLDPANYTKTDLYYIPTRTFAETKPSSAQIIKTGNLRGYSQSPTFAPNGKSLAFTRMKSDQYESDKPRLLLVPDIGDLSNVQEFFMTDDGEGGWDLRPESIVWSDDGETLYVTAEENGRGKLFSLPSSPRHATKLPTALTSRGTVADAKYLADGKFKGNLFISSSSLVDNSNYTILDPAKPAEVTPISSTSKGGRMFGLHQNQVDEFWYTGAGDYKVHAWVVKPSNFDKAKKYPLAYLIHGGPQGAWNEGWSTRWNPAIFAEQGYVVVTPNPTGSTGYGMALQNGIQNQWGGRPYEDLVKGFEYVESNLPYVDTSRAVALGASYGGFMVNWIQGHPLGRKFKALVTHDGVFSTLNQYSSEELFFPHHDFSGTLWDNRENYEKWDPAAHVKNWATPHLIIHNELDYRLPIAEGLAPFNVLQTKGIPSKFLTFPDENHWVLKPENSLVWHREVIDWINHYSGITEQDSLQQGVSNLKI
ncbi:dipeptidyl-peptidase-like protein V [Coleophoma crateriformis]|uniref:Dipeptidyl-peptidase V n=1 Tax=Coleophoma crateriformis TaxID=565419 RepID=A0A3D8QQA7_9HELO|nr:dipeptidyl-peptidase-like protein V [Coleophoma crateriformis]